MTAVVVKESPTPAALREWALARLATVPGFIGGATSVDERPTRLYDYQIAFMNSPSRFRAMLKARQTGLSFVMAAEALALSHLKPTHTGIFVSYRMDDATEKIRHADMLYDSLPGKWQRRRVTDNKTQLEFEDGQGRRSRLISLPCREPRGKGKADVYLDEMPFMRQPRKMYTAAVPIITRGGGTLTVGSTPLGKNDPFYEIMTDQAAYPLYDRFRVGWWDCPDLCRDVTAARAVAGTLPTEQMVERFGTVNLQQIRAALDLESFEQEYGLTFVDAAVAFIAWELIVAATRDADELPVAHSVDDLMGLEIAGPLWAGFDVGRRRNASELIILEQRDDRFRQCCGITLDQADFDLQEATLADLLNRRPDVYRLCIDETGIGMHLAERMVRRFPERVEPVTFTAPTKAYMASGLKISFERRNILIEADRETMRQIHSVQKMITKAGNIRLDTEHDEKHHADRFWALALAHHAATMPETTEQYIVHDDPMEISPF